MEVKSGVVNILSSKIKKADLELETYWKTSYVISYK